MNLSESSTTTSSLYYDAVPSHSAMTDPPVTNTHDAKSQPSTSGTDSPYEHPSNANTNGVSHPEKLPVDTPASISMTTHERAVTAENLIPHSATSRLSRNEVKDAKRVSKVLKNEGRTDAKVLKAALSELERLQKLHKNAAKDEAAALASHGKAIKNEHKMNMRFLDARAKHESSLADLKAREAALNATKEHVKNQAELLREMEAEIEEMRIQKAVEDREREAKLGRLTMNPTNVSPI